MVNCSWLFLFITKRDAVTASLRYRLLTVNDHLINIIVQEGIVILDLDISFFILKQGELRYLALV